MNRVLKILFGSLFVISAYNGRGQNETYLQPFSSPILANPCFAGLDKNTRFFTGNQHYYLSEDRAYNQFYATYDSYSEKLKGGIGVWLLHGTIGQENKSATELGFAYSGFKKDIGNGSVLISANLGMLFATKQWFTYILDEMLTQEGEPSSQPGKQFNHYYLLKPGTGFLYNSKGFKLGVSAKFPLQFDLSDNYEREYVKNEKRPISLTLYLAKKISGNRKGLKSRAFQTYPELIVFYNKEFILSRASLKIEHTGYSYGIFIQNDFTNSIHSLGGTIGYRRDYLSFNINSGVGVPGISDDIGVTFELSMGIIIPPVHYSKIYPWAPKRNR